VGEPFVSLTFLTRCAVLLQDSLHQQQHSDLDQIEQIYMSIKLILREILADSVSSSIAFHKDDQLFRDGRLFHVCWKKPKVALNQNGFASNCVSTLIYSAFHP
jgi:hypothetical protein